MNNINIELSRIELEILINAVGSAQPINKELEIVQFKLFHRLKFKLNDFNQ